MKKDALLSIAGVSFRYGLQTVLSNIDLDIERGEVVGIIGPNGAGKSTLLRLIAGYLSPDEGSITFSGCPLKDYDRRALARHIATLPQSLDMPFPYTVEEFILMGRYPYDRRNFSYGAGEKELVSEIMNDMNIGHLARRQINALSEGERQKVYLAQCIVQDPGVLLLDEPVSHLDIKHQMRVLEILEGLHAEGLTILMILHDLNLASEFCSRIVLVSQGSIYTTGSPATTLTYENIEKVYDAVVIVRENPLSKKPFVIPVSRKYLHGDGEPQR
jgi:iron complex transport system ATP-binding protein